MALKEIVDIVDSAIFQTIFLFLVPSVENRAHQVVCLLPLHYIVQNLVAVYPHKISQREVSALADDAVPVLETGLEETLFLLVLLLSVVD